MVTRHLMNWTGGEEPIRLLQSQEKRGPDMILVPFEPSKLAPGLFKSAVDMARETAAELVLLCVRSPDEVLHQVQECEHLYSNLKGLQAQLQARDIRVKIETVVGPVAKFVLDYADRHGAEMIVIPGQVVGTDRHLSV